MVMELLKGRDLSQLLKFNSPLSIELVIKCVIHVCAALDYAHQTGIIHRDINPANMILLDNGSTKLMEFGMTGEKKSFLKKTFLIKTKSASLPKKLKRFSLKWFLQMKKVINQLIMLD